jgi:hypothetical protein
MHWSVVIPTTAWADGLAAATLLLGAIADLMPAVRAAWLSLTEPAAASHHQAPPNRKEPTQ